MFYIQPVNLLDGCKNWIVKTNNHQKIYQTRVVTVIQPSTDTLAIESPLASIFFSLLARLMIEL